MVSNKMTLKAFMEEETLFEKKKLIPIRQVKKVKVPKDNRSTYNPGGLANAWFTSNLHGAESSIGSFGGGNSGAIGEGFLNELFSDIACSASMKTATAASQTSNNPDAGMTTYPSEEPEPWEEEPELKVNKVDQARQLFQAMFNRPNATRADIINSFIKEVGVTDSTAVSYYTRFLDEFGVKSKDGEESLGQGTGMGGSVDPTTQGAGNEVLSPAVPDEPEMEEFDDPNRAGMIRTVDNAHMVYKRQGGDGTFEELWIYNIHTNTHDELKVRQDILAGTDIPVKKTKSADGTQSYTITTLGNAQLLKVTGLPN